MKPNQLLNGDAALAAELCLGLSTIRRLRSARRIPYIKTGHRTIVYNLPKVLAALDATEIKAVTTTSRVAKGTPNGVHN
ncbi:MAG: hypothetical protein WCO60_12870 [Verrucomicrobiota bacterium]